MTRFGFRFTLGFLLLTLLSGCSSSQYIEHHSSLTAPATAQTRLKQAESGESLYAVIKGDTLSAIARRFGVSNLQLQYRNSISDPHSLHIGDTLIIPDRRLQVPSSFARKTQFIWPLKKLDVSSEFGTRNSRHKGIDLRAPRGTAIHASADGVVHFVGRQNGYGKVIILKHAGEVQTFYAHNDKNLVKKGQRVKQGEKIASVGRTGNASGNHVHFEFIRGHQQLNPRHYVSGNKG